jgi:hypothetical protein
MKRNTQLTIYFFGLTLVAFISACGKPNNTPPKQPTSGTDTLRPVSVSYYDGGNSAYPTVMTYKYDKANHLIQYGVGDVLVYAVGPHGVVETDFDSSTSNIFTTSYLYSLTSIQTDAPVDIYNAAPNQVKIGLTVKNTISGTTTSEDIGLWQFETTKEGLPLKEITSDNGGRNFNFAYDASGNLSTVSFVNLSGTRAGAVYSVLKMGTMDDKHSPFSGVQGYPVISYPQQFDEDYALAFCKNNPKQIVVTSYDYDTNALKLYETDDFVYTYNDKGYPTTIVETMTYASGSPNVFTRTYNYTYQ